MSAFVQSAEAVAQEKSFHLVSRHLVKEVISPNENVRKQVHIVETFLSRCVQLYQTVHVRCKPCSSALVWGGLIPRPLENGLGTSMSSKPN